MRYLNTLALLPILAGLLLAGENWPQFRGPQSTGVADGTSRLLLDGLPAGSTLTADGKRAIVPGQGTWDISEDGATATFRPAGTRIGRQPTPILYTAQDSEGRLAEPAVITVTTPMIPDLIRAAPYGEPFTLPVGEEAQNVRDST